MFGFVGSYTLGAGPFCTKPGLLVVPRGSGVREAVIAAASAVGGQPMLNEQLRTAFLAGLDHRLRLPGIEVLLGGDVDPDPGLVTPSLVAVPIGLLRQVPDLLEECFGPTSLLVEYDDEGELVELVPLLVARAGRVLWNGWPTGVAVTWSMQHGGPFPATTSALHGSLAIPS